MKPLHPLVLFLLLVISMPACPPVYAANQACGHVINVRGEAHILRNDSRLAIKRGVILLNGDIIQSGENARVAIKMIDEAILILGSNTLFHIQHYHYAAKEQQGSASLELLKGALRSITGLIGKTPEKDFRIRTSVATIGIRGTDFWVGTIFGNAADVALFRGEAIYIENQAGRVVIDTAGFGTTVDAINTPPSPPKQWPEPKYQDAQTSVSLIADDAELNQGQADSD